MKKTILILLLALPLLASAQATGYLGRKTILKTTLINGIRLPLTTLEVEQVLTRTGSISFGLSAMRYTPSDNVLIVEGNRIRPGQTERVQATIGFKRYFNRIIPAPQGLYLAFDLGVGAARYDFATRTGTDGNFRDRKAASTYLYMGLPTIGGQTMIGKRLSVDVKANIEAYYAYFHPIYDYQFMTNNLFTVRLDRFLIGPAFTVKFGFLL